MSLKIYTVTDFTGKRSLVRAHTAPSALAFKRAQLIMKAALASQDELLELAATHKVEDATEDAGNLAK